MSCKTTNIILKNIVRKTSFLTLGYNYKNIRIVIFDMQNLVKCTVPLSNFGQNMGKISKRSSVLIKDIIPG